MNELTIAFQINFRDPRVDFCPYGPLMHRWLPNNEQDLINLNIGHSDFILTAWFERRGSMSNTEIIYHPEKHEVNETLIPNQGILDAGILFCKIVVKNILQEEYHAVVNDEKDGEEYKKFAKRIIDVMLPPLNNFIRILKIKYGQYWLNEIPRFDSKHQSLGGYCQSFLMRWSVDGQNWRDFQPTLVEIRFTSHVYSDIAYYLNYITEEDWIEVIQEVNNEFSSSLSLELMIRCWTYFDQGDIDRAVIEGITSLELALDETIRKKMSRINLSINDIEEFKTSKLQTKVQVISSFNDQINSTEVTNVLELYAIRNKIVHDGIPSQPDIVQMKIRSLLNMVSKLILGKPFRFVSTNHGNAYRSAEEWINAKRAYLRENNSNNDPV